MFILRRINSDGIEMNKILGECYTLVSKERNPLEFERCTKAYFEEVEEDPGNGAINFFIGNGSMLQPLYANQYNIIMTSNGDVFEELDGPNT